MRGGKMVEEIKEKVEEVTSSHSHQLEVGRWMTSCLMPKAESLVSYVSAKNMKAG